MVQVLLQANIAPPLEIQGLRPVPGSASQESVNKIDECWVVVRPGGLSQAASISACLDVSAGKWLQLKAK